VSATEITVIGYVVNSPSRNRTPGGSKVTNFRMAATERRYDSTSQAFVNGNTFWIDVECWNDLGGNVSHSISKGDPVVVVGTISTHQWETEEGHRSKPRIKARVVAPNLAWGIADFKKTQRATVAAGEEQPPSDSPEQVSDAENGFVAGRDYEPDPTTLNQMNSDDAAPEPALR
jgi:single-strand DNA-binding protein